MKVKSLVICTCILLNVTGVVKAEDRSLSTSTIIALSVLFGFIFLVCLFCLICFSVRKYKANKRKKKNHSSSRLGITNSSFVETQISTTEIELEKPQQNNNQTVNKQVDFQDTVDLVDEKGKFDVSLPLEEQRTEERENHINGEINQDYNVSVQRGEDTLVERITDVSEERSEISDKSAFIELNLRERETNITSESNIGNQNKEDIALVSDSDTQDKPDQLNQMLNISPSDLENIVRERLASARSDSVDVQLDDTDYIDGFSKIIGDNSQVINFEAVPEEAVETVPIQADKTGVESSKMVVQQNVIYTQTSTDQVNTSYAPNGVVGPQLQRYTDWRNGNVTTQSMYVKNTSSTMNRSQISDMRPRTRSISPNRYQQRTYERGRSVKRLVVPTQVVSQPYSSVRVQPVSRTRQVLRSRSAPPLRQMTYVARVPETTGYTRSHYLAIKQPFSKKFLLPPVKVSEKFVPVGSQRVIVTKRPTVIPRPVPQPRQQEVIKGKVYHVQYNHQGSNTITRGVNALNLERTASASTINSGQVYYSTGYNGQYVTRLSSNSSQGVTGRAVYTNQLSYNSDVFDSGVQGTYGHRAPTSNGYYITEQNTYSPYQYKTQTQPTYYSQQTLIPMSDYTPKIMKTSFYQKRAQGWRYAENGTGSRPTSQVIEQIVTTSPRNSEPDYIYSTVVKTKEKVEQNGKTDEYTIVDYVENGTSAGKTTNPLSTSTPRFPERDTSALEDLDNVLGKSGSSTSSSSSDDNDN